MTFSKKKAFIIGIESYINSELPRLPSCSKDALDVSKLLEQYDYIHNTIIVSEQDKNKITGSEIWTSISNFLESAKSDEIVIFYFSGHGLYHAADNDLYLATPNTNPRDPSQAQGGIMLSFLLKRIRNRPSHTVLIIDACYSGAASDIDKEEYVRAAKNRKLELTEEQLNDASQEADIHLLLSSRSYQTSQASVKGNSLFSKFIISGLKAEEQEKKKSIEETGIVNPLSLHRYVRHNVEHESGGKQLPEYRYNDRYKGPPLTLKHHHDKIWGKYQQDRLRALRQAEVEAITTKSSLDAYYNVNQDEFVALTRKQTLDHLIKWITGWWEPRERKAKRIVLITGPHGFGTSWFTYEFIKYMLDNNYEILKVVGSRILEYDSTSQGKKGSIFIFDESHIRMEGLGNKGISTKQFGEIIKGVINSDNVIGPLIVSMDEDTWSFIIAECAREGIIVLDQTIEDKLIHKVDLKQHEAIGAAHTLIESYIDRVSSRNSPSQYGRQVVSLVASPQMKEIVVEKCGYALSEITLYLEVLIEGSSPLSNIKNLSGLARIFMYYLSVEENDIDSNAETLSLLYLISKFQPVSIGSIREIWRRKWVRNSSLSNCKFYESLKQVFFSSNRNITNWKLALLTCNPFGGLSYSQERISQDVVSLVENPNAQLEKVLSSYEHIDPTDKERNEYLKNIESMVDLITRYALDVKRNAQYFIDQYPNDISNWVRDTINNWRNEAALTLASSRHQDTNGTCRCRRKKKAIRGIDAYHFLSLFYEFVHTKEEKFDKDKYIKSGFAELYKEIEFYTTGEDPKIVSAITRLLYTIFEKASRNADPEMGVEITGYKGQLLYQLGTYETDLELMIKEYFPHLDINEEPHCRNDVEKMLILRRVGLDLMTIGRLKEAEDLYDRSYKIASMDERRSIDKSKVLQLKSELYIHQGRLCDSISAANQAILIYLGQTRGEINPETGEPEYYCSTGDEMWGVQNIAMGPIQLIICSLAYQAWTLHLAGEQGFAEITFQEAEKLVQLINPKDRPENPNYPNRPPPMRHLRDLWGIYYADFLISKYEIKADKESLELARTITLENLCYAECNELVEIESQCNRVLGDIEMSYGYYEKAKYYYNKAYSTAQKITHHAVWLEILLSMGLWHIKKGKLENKSTEYDNAISFLQDQAYNKEKRKYTEGYKMYHIHLQIAQAKAYLETDKLKAVASALESLNASRFLDNDNDIDGKESGTPIHYSRGICESEEIRNLIK